MPGKFGLDGGMIPRNVRRMFDQRDEPRFDIEGDLQTAVLTHGGRNHVVRVANISGSGAMVVYPETPHIGEEVTLQLLDHGADRQRLAAALRRRCGRQSAPVACIQLRVHRSR